MNSVVKCHTCGSEISSSSYLGQCAKCLLSLGVDPDTPQESPVPARTIQDFELLEQVGMGGMGVVYRARQRSLNREVAIKMLLHKSDRGFSRFRIEAEAGAKLQHPNIVPIYEIGGEGDTFYLAMELVAGGNLKQRLDDFLLLPAPQIQSAAHARRSQQAIATLLNKIARAVHFAHERGILHRDLKPENILLRPDGEPMLTDFGLAKIWDHDRSLTISGQVFGTLNYIAPEQAAGLPPSRGADIFSLGVILYELLARVTPFAAATPAQSLRLLAEEDPVNVRQINHSIDSDLAMICHKCLQKDFKDRYSTAGELADDLDRWLRGIPVQARPLPRHARVERWVNRNRAVTALLCSLVVGLAITLVSLVAIARQKSAKDRAILALRASVGADIYRAWSPKGYVEVASEELAALLGNEVPGITLDHLRLKIALFVHQNPMETVTQYRRLLTYLEREMEHELKQPVRLDLWLYKELTVESLSRDKADFVRINPLFYLDAKRTGLALQPLVRQINSNMRGVIVSRRDLGLKSLGDLQGRSLMFGEPNSTVTFGAKRVLVAAGITTDSLSRCSYVEPDPSSEFKKGGYFSRTGDAINAVVAGNYDCAVGLDRQIEKPQFRSRVDILARFDCPAPFWAGAPDLNIKTANAFSRAMGRLHDLSVLRSLPEDPDQPSGFERTTAGDYSELEAAESEASRFASNNPRSL
jgi:ABC-type phosphate/phosphonate transport system substrate-binding protein/tRNA A-37 threonylcarbamoyl transferase component Bud32